MFMLHFLYLWWIVGYISTQLKFAFLTFEDELSQGGDIIIPYMLKSLEIGKVAKNF